MSRVKSKLKMTISEAKLEQFGMSTFFLFLSKKFGQSRDGPRAEKKSNPLSDKSRFSMTVI